MWAAVLGRVVCWNSVSRRCSVVWCSGKSGDLELTCVALSGLGDFGAALNLELEGLYFSSDFTVCRHALASVSSFLSE